MKTNEDNVNSFICEGGSMRPVLKQGQMVYVKPGEVIKKGDCVCYQDNNQKFIHRVIGRQNGSYLIASDSQSIKNHRIPAESIIGKVTGANPLLHGFTGLIYFYIIHSCFFLSRFLKRRMI